MMEVEKEWKTIRKSVKEVWNLRKLGEASGQGGKKVDIKLLLAEMGDGIMGRV